MEKSKLTPFDSETILMILSIAGNMPEVLELDYSFFIKVSTDNINALTVKAIKDAVSGRMGKRIIRIDEFQNKIEFQIDYSAENEILPGEISSMLAEPNENVGYIYCQKLLEVRCLPVRREIVHRLIEFTGGGTMTIPRTPGDIAIYSFPTENGVMMDVPENWYIIRYPDGRFAKMGIKEFNKGFEPKDTSEQSISAHGKNDIYCGNCAAFKCEDMNGDGCCETCDTMRHCGDLACHEWQSKAENQQYKHFEERFNNKQ